HAHTFLVSLQPPTMIIMVMTLDVASRLGMPSTSAVSIQPAWASTVMGGTRPQAHQIWPPQACACMQRLKQHAHSFLVSLQPPTMIIMVMTLDVESRLGMPSTSAVSIQPAWASTVMGGTRPQAHQIWPPQACACTLRPKQVSWCQYVRMRG
ncbi:hypothetical protein TSOC_002815, partial [Tetrabaena socialis]